MSPRLPETKHSETKENPKWMIGIGASAGGLEALTLFISNLPEDFNFPILIAQHLAPHARSMMVELLQRHAQGRVVAASHRQKIEPGMIYVVPPNHDVDLVDHHILLTVAGSETRPKPSVDEFFTSLARAYGRHAVGIVLSGTGTDGSDGIKAIKAFGGITLAQDDRSAKYDGMPKSAVNTGDIDSILSPDQIAKELPKILAEHEARSHISNLNESGLARILSLVKQQQGTDFRQYKLSTIQRRLAKHMVFAGYQSLDEYYEKLESSPGEVAALAKEMLVSVTSFFRDPDVFETLEPAINRLISQKKNGEEIRVWVAGCATGEEAYTYAMIFADCMDRSRVHIPFKVFASDLDQDAILEARNGIYTEQECQKIPTHLREKFFEKRGDNYEASKRLREIVVFAKQDLTQNPPFVKLDLISCRNVLIYFDSELQKKVMDIFHYSLNPSGILVLGKSEAVSLAQNIFETVDRSRKIFTKLNVPSKPLPATRAATPFPIQGLVRAKPAGGPSIADQSYLKLLRAYDICGVTIDEDGNIIHIIGDVSKYLGFFSPQPDFRLANLLPKGIGVEIPILIRKAMKDGLSHRSRTYKSEKGAKAQSYSIVVRPLTDQSEESSGRQLFIVNFEQKKGKEAKAEATIPVASEYEDRVSELEHELFVTREHLQTVIEELGVTNEELQSLNEELSSTNEELQASSEELETTNEELQSSNEELTTLNEELNVKQVELRALNVSFENVQNSLTSPMVVLDSKKKVMRYNPEALKVFNFSNSDIGRDILKVSSKIEVADFGKRINDTLESGKSSETVVDVGNLIYQMRIVPCFDDRKSVIGAILTFVDNTQLIKIQEKVAFSEQRMRAVIDGSSSLIFLKDSMGRYLLINEAFRRFFQVEDKSIIGKTDREIFPDSIAVPLRDADLEVFVKRQGSQKQESLVVRGKTYHLLSNRFPLQNSSEDHPYAVGTVASDITREVLVQEELSRSESRYRSIIEDQAVFVFRHTPDGHVTYVNAAFTAQFGGSNETNVGQKFSRIFHESDRARIDQEILSINPAQPIVQYEHRIDDVAGKQRWVRWIHRGLFDSAGKAVEFQAVGFDVSESRNRTDLLQERDNLLSRIFNHSADFMTVFRVSGDQFILESFNRSAAQAFGVAANQLIGQNLTEFVDPSRAEATLEKYRKSLTEKAPHTFDERIDLPGGTRYFSTTLVPIPAEDGNIERIAAISRDVSNYKRSEGELRKARDEANSASQSKSEFLASMSHELRTPLNVVLGMAQLLQDTQMSSEQKNYLTSIERSGRVLLTLIEDILDVSKIEAGTVHLEAVAFNPVTMIEEVMDLFRQQAKEKGLLLTADMDTNVNRLVIGDPSRIRQILVNLVNNALKFTDKGQVTLKVTSKIEKNAEENLLHFSIKDTGIGIPEEAHNLLFQRFSQVGTGNARKYGGSGLGLLISKQLVQMMSGSIGFESEPGKGSTFWFQLPLALSKHTSAQQSSMPNQQKASDSNGSKSLRILAVDDNNDSRALLNLLLKKMGHKVTVAQDGPDALSQLNNGSYDLVLMDIQMPGMDGYEATHHIRTMSDGKSSIPIIALTANAMAGDSEKAFKAGMDDYITKPIHLDALKNLLAKWSQKIR